MNLKLLKSIGLLTKNNTKRRKSTNRRTIKKKQTVRSSKIQKRTPDYNLGTAIGKFVVKLNQNNPKKFYLGGYRIHHGPVGLGLRLLGDHYNDDVLRGLGDTVAKDDIVDLPQWFNLEKRENYTGFA